MDSTPEDPQEEEKEMQKIAIFLIGFAVCLGICLGLGLLDGYGYLDPILDYFGVS
jgi:hypothetical protein